MRNWFNQIRIIKQIIIAIIYKLETLWFINKIKPINQIIKLINL